MHHAVGYKGSNRGWDRAHTEAEGPQRKINTVRIEHFIEDGDHFVVARLGTGDSLTELRRLTVTGMPVNATFWDATSYRCKKGDCVDLVFRVPDVHDGECLYDQKECEV